LNVNADTAAANIARAIHSEEMVLVTDVPGLMKNNGSGSTVIHEVSMMQLNTLVSSGIITDGMIPKVEACSFAISNGVKIAHMVSGKEPHSILNQLIGGVNCGTRITL
jgi:acetylglutamate kinase